MIKEKECSPSSDTGNIDSDAAIRVNIGLLDTLMALAGELVLSRNQLLQGAGTGNINAITLSSQRIDLITSELQEAIMRTRMQRIDSILNAFHQLVREHSHKQGKSVDIHIKGREVELDKTILESINQPLTDLICFAIDHGIESPEKRQAKGKDSTAKISIHASHDAGQVSIRISDDGCGADPSQADGIAAIVDQIEAQGRIIEIDATAGQGTDIRIKLPLTLAIIPSQITSVGCERYAVPQANLDELLRIPAAQIKEKIELVGDAAVVRLRGELLPLLDLAGVLGIEKTYRNTKTGTRTPDRRKNIADRRSRQLLPGNTDERAVVDGPNHLQHSRQDSDRRFRADSAMNIAVVSAGSYKYGLIVDLLHDSEEIVVKPVGRHLKKCKAYAGATIMGDGKVALILDISNLAQMAQLATISETAQMVEKIEAKQTKAKNTQALITFKSSQEHFAAMLNVVDRIERIRTSDIEQIGSEKVIQYRGGALPLYDLSKIVNVQPIETKEHQEVIVFRFKDRELGLMVTPPVDTIEIDMDIDENTLKETAVSGSVIINGHTTRLLDVWQMAKTLKPDWF